MKKVLVTGGAGFIGSNIVMELQDKGHDVTVLDDYSSGYFKNLYGFTGDFLVGDESRLAELNEQFDVVFHQAAITDTTWPDDAEMMRKNIEGFRQVIAFTKKQGIPLVYASSAGVYGSGKTPMKENQERKPLNAYGYSKYVKDTLALKAIAQGQHIIGLRYFNVFGPREGHKEKFASMIFQLHNQMKEGKRPRIFKYGEQKRDHIYVKDVVAANLKAWASKESGIFNVGTGVGTSFNDIVKYLNKAMKTTFDPDYFDNPYVKVYQEDTRADISRTTKKLGWKPKYTVSRGVNEYVKWLADNE